MTNVAVSRTLVKSPPEVWAELEREGRLAELLDDETLEVTVAEELAVLEWRAEHACGRVEIKASGWGTKVSLTAEVENEEPVAEPEPEAVEPEPEPVAVEPEPEPVEQAEPETIAEEIQVTEVKVAKQGLWARIKGFFDGNIELTIDDIGRRPAPVVEPEPSLEASPAPEAEIEATVPEPVAFEPEPETESEPEPEPEPVESALPIELRYEQRLTAVLDHLGAAHKRPFSSM